MFLGILLILVELNTRWELVVSSESSLAEFVQNAFAEGRLDLSTGTTAVKPDERTRSSKSMSEPVSSATGCVSHLISQYQYSVFSDI